MPGDKAFLAETLDLQQAGCATRRRLAFPDGSLGEVFIRNHKAGNASDTAVRDADMLVSLLLQHGCIGEAITNCESRSPHRQPSRRITNAMAKFSKETTSNS